MCAASTQQIGIPIAPITNAHDPIVINPLPAARYLKFESFDQNYYNGWDLKSAMHPQTILAYAHNDQPLRPDHGAPLR